MEKKKQKNDEVMSQNVNADRVPENAESVIALRESCEADGILWRCREHPVLNQKFVHAEKVKHVNMIKGQFAIATVL